MENIWKIYVASGPCTYVVPPTTKILELSLCFEKRGDICRLTDFIISIFLQHQLHLDIFNL